MAQFISTTLQRLRAMATAGQIVAGNIYYANDQNPGQSFVAATDGSLVPMSSIILSGNITGTSGPAGPQGPAGANGQTPEQIQAISIAMAIALG